jgi:GalNAc-alpha-(1->4)-GalNAc-alpha-(1->3)-diNAcBac-PP-undecaprenol alpha-1,4-N-acetyl-D-galactosaminyltransferase
MKILFVISCLNYGGAEKNLVYIANNIAKQHQVVICNFNESETKQNISTEVRVFDKDKKEHSGRYSWIFNRFDQLKFLNKIAKKEKPNVIISFLNMPNMMAVIVGKLHKIPVIISERADPYQTISKLDKIIHRIYEKADGAVFQTEGAKEFYSKNLQKKSTVIPNPVMVNKNIETHDYTLANKEIVVIGRFENKQKRQDLAVKAFRIVVEKYPDYVLKFWGDGADQQSIRKLCNEYGISENVIFAGVSSCIVDDISNSEIFLLTSDYEGIPNSLIEAMSVGLPCVSTDCSPGGAKMLLEDGKNGILVPRGDVEKIAESIIMLIENKDLEIKYGTYGKASLERFTPTEIIKQWNDYILRFSR